MKIDSMDASGFSIPKTQDPIISTKDIKIDTNINTKDNKNVESQLDTVLISQLTQADKKDLPVSEKIVIDAIEKANKAISGGTRRFEFSIHSKTKEIMIKVIDSDTNEVVREIPPEKTLDMVAKLWEMAGIVVDTKR